METSIPLNKEIIKFEQLCYNRTNISFHASFPINEVNISYCTYTERKINLLTSENVGFHLVDCICGGVCPGIAY